jgi:hypothetical protein
MWNRAGRYTDTEHEWVYDRTSHIDKLEALSVANTRGWVVADMKKDWKRVVPFEE